MGQSDSRQCFTVGSVLQKAFLARSGQVMGRRALAFATCTLISRLIETFPGPPHFLAAAAAVKEEGEERRAGGGRARVLFVRRR